MNLANLIKEFITEAQEHIATAEEDILALEQDSSSNKETVNRLFRALHTIKGGAACVNFDSIKEFTHAMENVAGLLRDGSLTANPEITQVLLEGIDKVKTGIFSGKGTLDGAEETLQHLHAIAAQGPSQSEQLQTPSASSSKSIFNLRHYDTSEAKNQGLHIFEISVDAVKECSRNECTAAALLETISSVGTILATKPETNLFIDQAPSFSTCSFLLATMIDDPEVLLPGLQIEPLHYIQYKPENFPAYEAPIAAIEDPKPAAPQAKQTPTANPQPPPEHTSTVRTQEQTVRIPVEIADKLMNLAGELVVVRNRSMQLQASGNAREISTVNQRLDVVTSDIQRTVMRTRMQPVGNVFSRFTRVVRDLGRSLGKELELEITGSDVELDKSIIDGIVEPLTHLVRNAVDHGVEFSEERRQSGKPAVGHIRLSAQHQAGLVNIDVSDDGKGIDPTKIRLAAVEKGIMTRAQVDALSDRETLNLIFLPGFSTAQKITDVSGRGVGMDVVRASLIKLGGIVEIQSTPGLGSTISIRLPLTLAIIPAIILAVEDQCFAIPQVSVIEVVWLHGEEVFQSIQTIENSEVYWLRGKMLPLIRLSKTFNIKPNFVDPSTGQKKPDRRKETPDRRQKSDNANDEKRAGPRDRRISVDNSLYIIVLRVGSDTFGLCVERIVDTEEIVVKPLHDRLKASKAYAGVTVLGDGSTALILDVAELALIGGVCSEKTEKRTTKQHSSIDELQKMLVFTNGTERFAIPLCLLMRVDEVSTKEIQIAGGREFLCFRNSLIPLVRIENALTGITSHYDSEYIHAIIPKIGRPVGIAAARIIDIVEIDSNSSIHSGEQASIIGSQIVNGQATTLLDLCSLVDIVEPGWLSSIDQPTIKSRILLAEDSSLYRALASSYLRGMGLEVVTANNGKEAFEIILHTHIDCVVSDIEMPIMDGLDLARQLKANELFHNIPLVGMSAVDEKAMQPRALDAGFDEFRSKNNLPLLGETIEALLGVANRVAEHD